MTGNITLSEKSKSKAAKPSQQPQGFTTRFRGYAAVGLHQPKNNLNVGGVLRAAGCYGVALVMAAGARESYKAAPTDAMKGYRHLPFVEVDSLKEMIPYQCKPVAVDLLDEARALHAFDHPQRAFYIFGPENGTLDASITTWCSDAIYVPTNGSMNLAASVNVVLYDRQQKQLCKRNKAS